MSLEQQIGALVKASENLTGAVNGKIGEIDKKVDAAVKAIPELHKTFYIDSVAGNDNALGTQSLPIKTIYEAVIRTPINGSVSIFLKKNQDHFMSGTVPQFTNATNKKIQLAAYSAGSKPVIKMLTTDSPTGSILNGFIVSTFTSITVVECVIDTMSLPLDQTKPWPEYGGFVSREGSLGEVGNALISLSHSEIKIRDHQLSSHYGRVDYNFRAVIIHHVGRQVKLNSGGDTFYCTFNGVSLSDTSKTLKDCLSGATAANTLTNISLA
ncbi:hypothetical protein [Photobacterium piscicola]|uniref:hypothetical protein n=1 Tax=Photobacterium piscicola TaxID=1378299 RepID=UPI0038D1FAB8